MINVPSTTERISLLLNQWRRNLSLSNREYDELDEELLSLDKQLMRLKNRNLRISVFGKVGVGKSSLLNALLGIEIFPTDVKHGSTRRVHSVKWKESIGELQTIDLVDTPGIDEISKELRGHLAAKVAFDSDLILMVVDSDISSIELEAIKTLLKSGKPIQIVLNRCDQWTLKQKNALLSSIYNRLPLRARQLEIQTVSAAPRKVNIQKNGKVRRNRSEPRIKSLEKSIINLLIQKGDLLLALNALRQAESFSQSIKQRKLKLRKDSAQCMIGRYAAFKASGVAVNPFLMLDLAGGFACDTALVLELSKLYEIQMGGSAARQLISKVSSYNALLGGAQIGIQFALAILRQLLLFAGPFSGGLTLASAAPIALVQAALAVHTTKLTGRLAAKELLQGRPPRREIQPGAMLKRLAASDPQVKRLLREWPKATNQIHRLQTLLP